MDYELIQDANHNAYVEQIIGLINTNTQTNSMNMFIEKIIKQPEEYQILCNALYWFIKGPPIQQGGTASSKQRECIAEKYEINPETQCDLKEKKPIKSELKKLHPDRNKHCKDAATKKFQDLTNACSEYKKIEPKAKPEADSSPPSPSPPSPALAPVPAEPRASDSEEPAPTTEYYQDKIIKTLEKLKSKTFINIPHKNKLLIDQSFKQSNYKHYLSFYIINQQYI